MKRNSKARARATAIAVATMLVPIPSLSQGFQSTVADTLRIDAVISQVRSFNAGLEAARQATRRQEAMRTSIASLPEPRLGITYLPEPIYTARGTQRSQIRVEQMIPVPGTVGARKDIADYAVQMADAGESALLAELTLQAKLAFYDLHRSELLTALISDFEGHLLQFEDVALAQYSVGTGMQQAVLKAQLERANLSRVRLQIEGDRADALSRLAGLTGEPIEPNMATPRTIMRPNAALWQEHDLEHVARVARSDLRRVELEGDQAEARQRLASRSRLPELGLNATYFDIAPSDLMPTATGKDALAIGAMVKIPLNRGSYSSDVQQAALQKSEADYRRSDLLVRISSAIQGTTQQLTSFGRQLQLIGSGLVPRAETTLEVTLNDYTNGRAAFLDLLDAERTLYNLRSTEIETHIAYLKTVSKLERVLEIESVEQIPTLTDGKDAQ